MREDEAKEEDAFVKFMAGMCFLRKYDEWIDIASRFDMNTDEAADACWLVVARVAALKPFKIRWLEDDEWDTINIASVDGSHCLTNERRCPDIRRDPKNYSHKFHMAGINHEIAIHLWENRCVHARTTLASKHDGTIFLGELVDKIPEGKRVIADRGYQVKPWEAKKKLAIPNPLDRPEVAQFKSEARSRHENYNGLLKVYKCLAQRFRHSKEKQMMCFDAVIVLVQYAIEDTSIHGEPLNSL
jgi:hypothetical protein